MPEPCESCGFLGMHGEGCTVSKTCARPLRDGPCKMEAGHRGRCSTAVFDCDACGKTRRGSPASHQHIVLGDGTVDDTFQFCFMCSVVEPSQPGYGHE